MGKMWKPHHIIAVCVNIVLVLKITLFNETLKELGVFAFLLWNKDLQCTTPATLCLGGQECTKCFDVLIVLILTYKN